MNKELLQQKAEAKYPYIPPRNGLGEIIEAKAGQSPPDYKKFQKLQTAFLAGAKEILNNLEQYGLVKKDKYDELEKKNESLRSSLSASERFRMQDAAEHLDDNLLLRKENRELKDKVTELEGVIAKLSQKVILYESNY